MDSVQSSRNSRRRETDQGKHGRKRRRGLRVLFIFLVVIIVVAVGVFLGWKVFVLEKVDVVGNEIYSDEQIEEWVLSDEGSWNTLYDLFRNRFGEQEEIPFVNSMEVRLVSPTEIEINVVEKGVLGYLYLPAQGENAYFDQDGFVVELSNDIIEGVCKVSGLNVESAVLYEKLDLTDSGILKTMLSLTQLLKKYDLVPEVIYIQGSNLLLSYGAIQVDLGNGTQLNEKILRMQEILPRLEGMQGTLHLNAWSETSPDIPFTPGELTEIPVDRQTVSVEGLTQ